MQSLHGFALGNFRSFKQTQRVGPLAHLNVLAGENNSGKSNALLFLRTFRKLDVPVGELDIPLETAEAEPANLAIATPLVDVLDRLSSRAPNVMSGSGRGRLTELFQHLKFLEGELVWVPYAHRTYSGSRSLEIRRDQLDVLTGWSSNLVAEICREALSSYSGDSADNLFNILHRLIDPLDRVPEIETVLPVRQVEPGNETALLIETIDEWRNPPPGRENAGRQQKYTALNALLQRVTADETAEIHIPTSRDTVIVRTSTRSLPLENLGTGTHQLIFLAVAATRHTGRVVCIEEPEVHMHPTMQRQFLDFLQSDSGNQYLITTHSAVLVNDRESAVFAFKPSEEGTLVSRASSPNELVALTQDMGYRASDLIQTNYVVWVEGPSDRLYLIYWIGLAAPELVEGVHYSVMFYGGALLPHLSARESGQFDEEGYAEFVSLCRLNRNFTLLMDSDRRSPTAPLSAAKERLIGQVEKEERADYWVTDGYTIENYLPVSVLQRAVSKCHPRVTSHWRGGRFVNPLRAANLNKVRIARAATLAWREAGSELPGDLESQVQRLIRNIRRCQVSTLMKAAEPEGHS